MWSYRKSVGCLKVVVVTSWLEPRFQATSRHFCPMGEECFDGETFNSGTIDLSCDVLPSAKLTVIAPLHA